MTVEEQLKLAIAALKTFASASSHKEDPELDSQCSWGNYDDVFYDGSEQAYYNVAREARDTLEHIGVVLDEQ